MKPQHHTFIRECILHGDKHRAYKSAYPNATGESLKIAARRLYRRPEIKQVIEEAITKARQQAVAGLESATAESLQEELATLKLKRQVLLKMMTGEFKVTRRIRLKDRIEDVTDDLSAFAILRAIELDTKLINNWFEKTIPVQVNSNKEKSQPITPLSPANMRDGEGPGVRSNTGKNSSPVFRGGGRNETTDGGVPPSPPVERGAGGEVRPLSTVKYISPYDDEYIGCRYDPKDPNTKEQFARSMIEQQRQREERKAKEKTIQNDTISPPLSLGERPAIQTRLRLSETNKIIMNELNDTKSPSLSLGEGQGERSDLWQVYITHDRNTARLPKDDRAAKEHWFRNKTIQNQLKLIELYKDKTA